VTSDAAAQLAVCGFPARWAGNARCVLLHTAFGDGSSVLAAWHAWRTAAAGGQLVLVAIAAEPPSADALMQSHVRARWAAQAQQLAAAWPPPTPDLHLLDLEPGVRLLLAAGQRPWLRLLRLQANLVLADPRTPPPGAPGQPAAWDTHALKALGRLTAPGAVVLGLPGKLPRPDPRRPAPATQGAAGRSAVVIGAGIAGACTASALARVGWACTVLDAQPAPAMQASGNPAALFHGTVHAGDGLHARFTRACALHATQRMRALIAAGVPGRAAGLLRAHADAAAARGQQQPWPAGWVQRLEGAALHQRAPLLQADSAWLYPGGGWIAAAQAVQHLLQAPDIQVQCNAGVHALQRADGGWQALDASGKPLASGDCVVLTTAGHWPLLLGADAPAASIAAVLPPAQHSRGQVTWFDGPADLPDPVAGHGYAVAWEAGRVLCGASSQVGDADPAVREDDHRHNLQRLFALTGITPQDSSPLHGRVGWRHQTDERLPLVGAVPQGMAEAHGERLRDVARVPGLWMLAGLGGRGFTWAPLLGEALAALMAGGPWPMEARLIDAVDPARQAVKAARGRAEGER
jgi:tRNA 5-methylaminomethyl-2-thiouridine biosynthesis bifunctional protein